MNSMNGLDRILPLIGTEPLLQRLLLASTEAAVLVGAVALLIRLVRFRSIRVVCLLWMIVLLKPVVSVMLGSLIPIVHLEVVAGMQATGSMATVHTAMPIVGADRGYTPLAAPGSPADLSMAAISDKDMPTAAPVGMADSPIIRPSWLRIATIVWLTGVALALGYYLWSRLRLGQVIRRARPAPGPLAERYRAIGSQLSLARVPQPLITEALESPAIVGVVRPRVLLPAWLATQTDDGRLDWSIRHELTHYRWLDPWGVFLRDIALILFWFHPALWWSGRRLVEAMELACDRAMLQGPQDASDYASQLFQMLQNLQRRRRLAIRGGLFATRTQVGRRIEALLAVPFRNTPQLTWASAAAIVLVAGTVFAFGGARIVKEKEMAEDRSEGQAAKDGGGSQPPVPVSQTVVTGRLLDPSGQPAADVPVAAVICGDTPWFFPAAMEPFAQGRTDQQGRFRLVGRPLAEPRDVSLSVHAWKPGYAVACHEFHELSPASKLQGLTLRLAPEEPVAGRVLDPHGDPVEGARVDLSVTAQPDSHALGRFLPAQYQARPQPATTDAQGRFTLHGVTRSQYVAVLVDAPDLAPLSSGFRHEGTELTLSMSARNEYEAAVVREDGQPIADAVVALHSQGMSFMVKAVTDAQGRFQAAPQEGWLQMAVFTPDGGTYQWEYGPRGKDVRAILETHKVVIPGVTVRGTVVEAPGGSPVADAVAMWHDGRWRLDPSARATTDAQGRFSLIVRPARGAVLVSVPGSLDYIKQQVNTGQIRDGQPGGHRMNVDGAGMVDVKPDGQMPNVVVTLRRGIELQGSALQPDGTPVAEGEAFLGDYIRGSVTVTRRCPIRDGRFTVSGIDPEGSQKTYLLDAAAQNGAVATLSAKDPKPVRLAPCGAATVRFVDPSGKPCTQEQIDPPLMLVLDIVFEPGIGPIISDRKAWVADTLCWANADHKRYKGLQVDPEGRVTFPSLIPGAQYAIRNYAKPGQPVRSFSVESGQTIDLGDIIVEPGKPIGSIDLPWSATTPGPTAP